MIMRFITVVISHYLSLGDLRATGEIRLERGEG